jgi:hypothetical protein
VTISFSDNVLHHEVNNYELLLFTKSGGSDGLSMQPVWGDEDSYTILVGEAEMKIPQANFEVYERII